MNYLTYSYSPYRKQPTDWREVARKCVLYGFIALVTLVVTAQVHMALLRVIAK